MNELDYLLDIHRREARRAQAAIDLAVIGLAAVAAVVYLFLLNR